MATNSTTQNGDTTPNWWTEFEDSRKKKGAMKYPNAGIFETPSGHAFIFDDSKDNESVTLQHRSGAMVQFKPDGAVHVKSHNGMHTIVMGENRVYITGAYDVTVEGGGSMRVKGDFDQTVEGNFNQTVHGDINTVAKNQNTVIAGNIDTIAKNQTTKIEGNIQTKTTKGAIAVSAQKGLALASEGDSTTIYGKGDIGFNTTGNLSLKTSGKLSFKASDIRTERPIILGGENDAETIRLGTPPTV